jgi:hypothetical protein
MDNCIICLEPYNKSDKIKFNIECECVMVYHKDCILKWLETNQCCPICKKNWSEYDYTIKYVAMYVFIIFIMTAILFIMY